MAFWKELLKKYKHFIPVLLYMIFYMSVFTYVENRPGYHLHLMSSRYDNLVPFCEFFVIPYFLWFLYVAAGVFYFGVAEKERENFYLLCTNLCIGMTLFLIVSLVWPNGHTLRPTTFPRENIFTDMVRALYLTDTSTNVLPSIHVFNSVAIHTAVAKSSLRGEHPWIVRGSFVLCVSIILATMFLKQHTVIDVVIALALNYATYHLVYQPRLSAENSTSKYRKRRNFIK